MSRDVEHLFYVYTGCSRIFCLKYMFESFAWILLSYLPFFITELYKLIIYFRYKSFVKYLYYKTSLSLAYLLSN